MRGKEKKLSQLFLQLITRDLACHSRYSAKTLLLNVPWRTPEIKWLDVLMWMVTNFYV